MVACRRAEDLKQAGPIEKQAPPWPWPFCHRRPGPTVTESPWEPGLPPNQASLKRAVYIPSRQGPLPGPWGLAYPRA
jgi:hypothetical protein